MKQLLYTKKIFYQRPIKNNPLVGGLTVIIVRATNH